MTPVFVAAPLGGAGEISRLYEDTGDPGVVGVVHDTSSDLSPNFRVGGFGVSGRASGRATAEVGDGLPSPTRFVAVTANVYSTLLVSPSRVHVVDVHCLV